MGVGFALGPGEEPRFHAADRLVGGADEPGQARAELGWFARELLALRGGRGEGSRDESVFPRESQEPCRRDRTPRDAHAEPAGRLTCGDTTQEARSSVQKLDRGPIPGPRRGVPGPPRVRLRERTSSILTESHGRDPCLVTVAPSPVRVPLWPSRTVHADQRPTSSQDRRSALVETSTLMGFDIDRSQGRLFLFGLPDPSSESRQQEVGLQRSKPLSDDVASDVTLRKPLTE